MGHNFNLNLFDGGEAGQIEVQINRVVDEIFGQAIVGVGRDGIYFFRKAIDSPAELRVFDESGERVILRDKLILTKDSILSSHGFVLGRIQISFKDNNSCNTYQSNIDTFRKRLLNLEYDWIINYIDHLKSSLSARESEGKPIIKHDAVMLSWADLVELHESLYQLLRSDGSSHVVTTEEVNVLAPSLVRDICARMGRLAGGRGYLEGQAINMLMLFEIINQIFFGEVGAHE